MVAIKKTGVLLQAKCGVRVKATVFGIILAHAQAEMAESQEQEQKLERFLETKNNMKKSLVYF